MSDEEKSNIMNFSDMKAAKAAMANGRPLDQVLEDGSAQLEERDNQQRRFTIVMEVIRSGVLPGEAVKLAREIDAYIMGESDEKSK